MKRLIYPSLFVIVVVLSTASTCKEDDDEIMANQKLATTLGTGTWRITYFFDQQEETTDFEGYVFDFSDNGIIIARKTALSVQGSWDTEDSGEGYTKLYMDFGAGEPLEELNEDWRVTANSGVKISFDHESGGNGDVDVMVLERN